MKRPDIHIPDEQKQALTQAILTLLSVLFGIGLTLASQTVTQIIMPPEPAIIAPGSDEMQTLGSTHFTDIYADNLDVDTALTAQTATITGTLTAPNAYLTTAAFAEDLTVTDTLTLNAIGFTNTTNITITGVLTNVTIIYKQN